MIHPRVTLLEMMAFILFSAVILGAVKLYDDQAIRDDDAAIAIYLVVLCSATVGANSYRVGRQFWFGVAFYGWVYLALALHFMFSVSGEGTARSRCLAALPMGVICGLASWWFLKPRLRNEDVDSPKPSA